MPNYLASISGTEQDKVNCMAKSEFCELGARPREHSNSKSGRAGGGTAIDLIGNVYARFKYEEVDALNARRYAARPIYLPRACCRLNPGEGGFCNFIHRKKEPSKDLERELELAMKERLKIRGRDKRSVSRSPSPGGGEKKKRRRDDWK
ncbi:hypothetical protein FN846DRAFT_899534 [Sphaerosporella brunnea]|uniref:C3H1-type domain-containing protein n=1 Tax=Sphaerosporella brunnea TaxID=1250544 RepID=A0A5J5ESP0_9PEZI|nr:hypothetical protein FN846DRAFT_899534 [Sphaerosporella brunnea]